MKTLLESIAERAPQAVLAGSADPYIAQMKAFGERAASQLGNISERNATRLSYPQGQQFSGSQEVMASAPGFGNNPSQDIAKYGFASNVPASLINSESGGNWAAANAEGYRGILQFGDARFADAKRAGVVPASMTIEQFGSNTPEGRAAQVNAANWHFADIDNRIRAAGFDRLVNTKVGDTIMSWNGMRAMAHLGGFGGLSKFIRTNGAYNPGDSNNTTLAAYGKQHYSAY